MGILINVMERYCTKSSIKNVEVHNKQISKVTGNRDDDLKKYNVNILELIGMETIDNYWKYINEHSHIGYDAHKNELQEGDFVIPRSLNSTRRLESIIVCPPTKILLSEIDKYNMGDLICFAGDYVSEFLLKDKKTKDIKILSVMLHCNEVYYPKWEETEELLPNGEHKIRRLTKEESKVKAYIKPHFHIDYIPLTECEKDGIKYLKLCSNDIWKAEKGKYYNSYSEFNDRCYDVIGKEYGYERGTQWEEWNERIQKKRNGEKVKEQRKLHDFQIDEETKCFERYIKQLQAEYNVEIEKIAREYNSKKSAIQKKTEEYTIELMKIEKETADKIKQAHERAQAEYDAVIKDLGLRNNDYPDNAGIFHSDLADSILR